MAVITQFIFAAVLCPIAHADQFLSRSALRKDAFEEAVFSGLTGVAHNASVQSVKREMETMFSALPKNAHGNLDPSTVRYALHRYFVDKHGWFVKGLDPADANLDFSTSGMVKEKATKYIQDIFDKKLNGRGVGLEDLANFAIMVADLVHAEAVEDLERVYSALRFDLNSELSLKDFDTAIRAFLSEAIVFDAKIRSRTEFEIFEERARLSYPEYDDIVMWARDMHLFTEFSKRSRDNPFISHGIDFDHASSFMKLIVHHFGSLLNMECQTMKDDLVKMQIGDSGRLLVSDFYGNRDLQLHESFKYLKNLGVVEESETYSTRLVISNYISSKSRCLPFSGYYAVCCPDECHRLLGRFEREFTAPVATPEMIIDVVSRTVSSSMMSPSNVSATLFARLTKIASTHGGKVPLHGRLFKQWMHYVYPLECSFPHITGTVNAVNQDEWLVIHEEIDDAMTTDEERLHFTSSRSGARIQVDDMPWSDVEEVVGFHHHQVQDGHTFKGCLRLVMGLVLLVSFLVPSVRGLSILWSKRPTSEKQFQHWSV